MCMTLATNRIIVLLLNTQITKLSHIFYISHLLNVISFTVSLLVTSFPEIGKYFVF